MRDSGKILCIGFHKTGTTSLALALEQLSCRVTGPNGVRDSKIARTALEMAKWPVADFYAFQDNPWPVIYLELDAAYPGTQIMHLTEQLKALGVQINQLPHAKKFYEVPLALNYFFSVRDPVIRFKSGFHSRK